MNNYQLESTLVQNSISSQAEKIIVKYKSFIAALVLGVVLAITINLILGVFVSILICLAIYTYQLWLSISSMSFTTEGLNFDLSDVVKDLEYM